MSVSRCLTPAMNLAARTPRAQWKAQIDALPEACQHPEVCTCAAGCRAHVAAYLRVQWRAQERLEQIKAGKRR